MSQSEPSVADVWITPGTSLIVFDFDQTVLNCHAFGEGVEPEEVEGRWKDDVADLDTFRAFVAACLTKDPAERPDAAAALAHPFAAAAEAGGGAVLRELVQASSPRSRRDLAASSHASPARSPAELPLASRRRRTCRCAPRRARCAISPDLPRPPCTELA